jgi:PAS domain S-box-containing protein
LFKKNLNITRKQEMEQKKNWSKFTNWFISRPLTIGFLVFTILSIVTIYAAVIRQNVLKGNTKDKMDLILNDIHQNIENSLRKTEASTFSLALTINDSGISENFEETSKEILKNNPLISMLGLAPQGIIKHIYPLKGNKEVLNLNLLESASLKGQNYKTTINKNTRLDGPFRLKQGGIGLAIRLPIYKKNKFWGFSSAIIKLESLLKDKKIIAIDNSKYIFQLSKTNSSGNSDTFFLPHKINFNKDNYATYIIPNSPLKLYLAEKTTTTIYPLTLFTLGLGFSFSLLTAFLTILLLKKPNELQKLINDQLNDLLKNEIQFKAIFEQATIGFAIVDANWGHFNKINDKFCEILEYSREEIIDKHFKVFIHPNDVESSLQKFASLKSGEIKDYSAEKRYLTKSGKRIWVNISVSPLWNKNEVPTSNIVIVKDITLRKEAQLLIQKSEIRFKTLFENLPIPLWEEDFSAVKKYLEDLNLMNQDAEKVHSFFEQNPQEVFNCISLVKVIDVNNGCLKLHEAYDKQSLLGNLNRIIDTNAHHDVIKQLVAISQNNTNFKIDTRVKTMNGDYRDINLRWNVIHTKRDTFERVIVSTEDITERKLSEQIILDSQEKIKSIINTIDGIVWEYRLDSKKVSFVSQKVEEILGYTVEEWISIPNFWKDHIYPNDREQVLSFKNDQHNPYENRDFEYRMISKTDKIIWIRDIVNTIVENNTIVGFRGIMIDITKMKKAQRDLNNSLDLLTKQNKRLLNFSYIVSHNLRSHTSNIASILSLLESSESEDEHHEMMQLIKTASHSLSETIEHLNEVININTNHLVTKPLHLNQYVVKIQNILSEQILSNDATILSTIPDDLVINHNPAYLESILYNLMSNAIRYKHPERKPLINLKWSEENNIKTLEFSDNGIGIDMDKNKDKLFGMYKTFSNNPDSRGIGLFITRNQIEAVGGNITTSSEPNVGTTFKINFK